MPPYTATWSSPASAGARRSRRATRSAWAGPPATPPGLPSTSRCASEAPRRIRCPTSRARRRLPSRCPRAGPALRPTTGAASGEREGPLALDHAALFLELAQVRPEGHLGGAQQRLLVPHLRGVDPPGQLARRARTGRLSLCQQLALPGEAMLA